MRFLFFVLGSRGDLEVHLMLGHALRSRGHGVTVAGSAFYAGRVRESGMDYCPIDLGPAAGQPDMVRVMQSLGLLEHFPERTQAFNRRWVVPQAARAYARVAELARGYDGFSSSIKMLPAGPDGFPLLPTADVYPELGNGPAGPIGVRRPEEHRGRVLNLAALNRAFADPGGLWDGSMEFTGFWNVPEMFPADPDPALRTFVESGPPPVAVTFGSMVMFDPVRLMGLLAAALEAADLRAVVLGGWSRLADSPAPPGRVFAAKEASYDWLFPRSACVLHHASYGTTSRALRHGVPSVTLPQVDCQEAMGSRLVEIGTSAGQFRADELTSAELADALARAARGPGLRRAAAEWRDAVVADPGLGRAAEAFERFAAGLSPVGRS